MAEKRRRSVFEKYLSLGVLLYKGETPFPPGGQTEFFLPASGIRSHHHPFVFSIPFLLSVKVSRPMNPQGDFS